MNGIRKAIKGWKTVGFNAIALAPIAVEIIGGIANLTEVQALIPDGYLKPYLAIVAIGNIFLRTRTTTPLGKKI